MNGESKSKQWMMFEDQVRALFQLKGYETTPDIQIAGRQTDILLFSMEEAIGSILVECKYHDPVGRSRVGVAEVEDFAARVQRLRMSGDVSAGYLVTNTDFTANAKGALRERSEGKYVFLRTFDNLQRRIINFENYLIRCVDSYESSDIFNKYQPIDVWDWPITSDETGVYDGKRVLPAYDEFDRTSCDETLLDFVANESVRTQLLVGDYGTGKTSACNRLNYELAKQTLAIGLTGRIPIYIPLKHYYSSGNIPSLVRTFLSSAGFMQDCYESFLAMNEAGFLVLILDGFDEMARRVTTSGRSEAFRDIVRLAVPNAKIIIAGRPGYFPSDSDLVSTLDSAFVQTPGDRIRRSVGQANKSTRRTWSSKQMAPMDEEQVLEFLSKRIALLENENRQDKLSGMVGEISQKYNLAELAERPILLEMIFETLDQEDGPLLVENAAELYTRYVNAWLQIEIDKGEFRTLISPEDRLYFSMVLAWTLLDQNRDYIPYHELYPLVSDYFQLDEYEDLDHFSNDVRTCTFLVRDPEGNYHFAHPSFWEYFCARYIVSGRQELAYMRGGKPLGWEFGSDSNLLRYLDVNALRREAPAILGFIDDLLGFPLNANYWGRLNEQIEDYSIRNNVSMAEIDFVQELSLGRTTMEELPDMVDDIKYLYDSLEEKGVIMDTPS